MIRLAELGELAADPLAGEELALSPTPLVAVDARRWPPRDVLPETLLAFLGSVRAVTVAIVAGPPSGPAAEAIGRFDVVLAPEDDVGAGVPCSDSDGAVEQLRAAVTANPQASVAAAQLLRLHLWDDAAAGLLAESLTYSMLQAGPEFGAWLATRPTRAAAKTSPDAPVVRLERDGSVLRITLARPERHNAFDHHLRDELVDALRLVAMDRSIEGVLLTGDGPSFCSGGDLGEFGTTPDPATAHHVRLARSAAWWLDQVGARVRVTMHGTCIGAGVELAAYAGTVLAHRDTTFRLPEVGMGLVPGAGGTVSVPRRIGPWRTNWLAITGTTIDAPVARTWGLVDRLVNP